MGYTSMCQFHTGWSHFWRLLVIRLRVDVAAVLHGAGPYRCPSLTRILTWVLSRLQQIENRLGLAVYLVLNLDHLP